MKLRWLGVCVLLASCGYAPSPSGTSPARKTTAEQPREHDHSLHGHTDDEEMARMIEAREGVLSSEAGDFLTRGLEKYGLGGGDRKCGNAFNIFTPPPSRKVVLTFDDGPDKLTPGLLDTLKKHKVRATFFVVGKMAVKGREILERMKREGHIVASHSWSHPNFPKTAVSEQFKQIDDTEKEIAATAAKPKLYRFPYGAGTCDAWDHLITKKYGVVGWHVDSCDWAFNKTGEVDEKAARICNVAPGNRASYFHHVIDSVEASRGGIILFHDAFRTRTIPQMESIIVELKNRGYAFANLDDREFRDSIWWKAP